MKPAARLALGAAVLGAGACVAGLFALERIGVTPRALAPYIEKRSSGHNPLIVGAGRQAAGLLRWLDRGTESGPLAPEVLQGLTLGAQGAAAGADRPEGVLVADIGALRAAMAGAAPGTVITIAPGRYRLGDRPLEAGRAGLPDAPIVVRASIPGSVGIASGLAEAFRIEAPYWRFENLVIDGVCKRHDDCEHAFHVVGAASDFAAVNNRIGGFNAHFKINGARGQFPDNGLIESNTLFNPAPRATGKPVTPVDLVAASGWTVRGNIIRDFVKLQGNRVSYGGFAKGGGSGNVFERNLVWCEAGQAGLPGQRVGLSLGGGGTGKSFCRDGRCITEQDGGVLRANLIVGCSDAGIYLNSAAASRVEDNTLVDTGGIDVRFATSSAQLDGNLVDGAIRSRDGGLLRGEDNRDAALWQSFVGHHPVRSLFVAPARGDFGWSGALPQRHQTGRAALDLCGAARAGARAYGAFEDFGACWRR